MRYGKWTMLILILITTNLTQQITTTTDIKDKNVKINTYDKPKLVQNNVATARTDKVKENRSQSESNETNWKINERQSKKQTQIDIVKLSMKAIKLISHKERKLYELGIFLKNDEPARQFAAFGEPSKIVEELSKLGYGALEASKKLAKLYHQDVGREVAFKIQSRLLDDECPLNGLPKCLSSSRKYRTADGTCNNLKKPLRASSNLPFHRFLPPVYQDGIEEIRKSKNNQPLPSSRDLSWRIHNDKNIETPYLTLMFMQWGQFLDHDLVSTAKFRGFNGTIPRCCNLPLDLLHPFCLPIPVSLNDPFYSRFNIECLEFIRSAPSLRKNCNLGWREQINQATSWIDASSLYGNDVETANSIRTFKGGKLQYGRHKEGEDLQPPDPPQGELCRRGALITDCFPSADGRVGVQVGLVAIQTIFIRYHNKIATILGLINKHWTDQRIYQETRKIVGAVVQHITYKEFLPILLGNEVMDLFELTLLKEGYYENYDERINPTIANSFSTAAFRFGHSLVPNSFIRYDEIHRPIFNNVSLHEEKENIENIWSVGSVDRLLLGFCNQPSQARDAHICAELTNHLFQTPGFPFGMDLAAINIQRGRDHGIPPYTSWRKPCFLSPIKSWSDLYEIMSKKTVDNFRFLYQHFDDIDLFSGGLAEYPVRGGILGPTFACIIGQQFLNLKKGDRFWYENGNFESSFTPAQLQQIRHVNLAQILCQTLTDIKTIQPFVFLTTNIKNNHRIDCNNTLINTFDLVQWTEQTKRHEGEDRISRKTVRRNTTMTRRKTQNNNKQYHNVDMTHVKDKPPTSGHTPIEVNIKIQYYPPTTPKPKKKKRKSKPTRRPNNSQTQYYIQNGYNGQYYQDELPLRPITNTQGYNTILTTNRLTTTVRPTPEPDLYLYSDTNNNFNYIYNPRPDDGYRIQDLLQRPSFGQYLMTDTVHDKLDFHTRLVQKPKDDNNDKKFVKISSVKHTVLTNKAQIKLHATNREGDSDIEKDVDYLKLVDLNVVPSEQWVFYHETLDNVTIPNVQLPISNLTSNELPRPIVGL